MTLKLFPQLKAVAEKPNNIFHFQRIPIIRSELRFIYIFFYHKLFGSNG